MNPIDNKVFSDDFHKFVLQDNPIITVGYAASPKQKFTLEKTKKDKKPEKKQDSPWLPKNKNSEEDEKEE